MSKVFKNLDESSLMTDNRYAKMSFLNYDKAIAYKNSGWNLSYNSSFSTSANIT